MLKGSLGWGLWVLRCVQLSAMVPAMVSSALLASTAHAQTVTVYRCPGPPVLFTDQLNPAQARERDCRVVQEVPVAVGAVVATGGGRGAAAPGAAASGATSAGSAGAVGAVGSAGPAGSQSAQRSGARIRPEEQQARDAAARGILETELRREEQRLAQARAARDEITVRRAEADVAAIRRELARLR